MYRKDFSNVAANVVDASIKENTAKALETLKRDAEFWLPQVKLEHFTIYFFKALSKTVK